MTETIILRATHGSPEHPLKIGDIQIPCYVLEDERRVIVQGNMITALDMSQGTASAAGNGDRLVKFATGKAIGKYTPAKVVKTLSEPILFLTPSGILAKGYEATTLSDLCRAVVRARQEGKLNYQTEHIADRCELLLQGFERVGIIALIDEATGYQTFRPRDALEKILTSFISEKLMKWTKMFPDEFYKELFRLRGWAYSSDSVKRPGFTAELTKDLVYHRLAPGVLQELERITPRDSKGRLKHRYHQRLTEDVGHPKLKEHFASLITLMKASSNWVMFQRLANRALPRYDLPASLFTEEELSINDEFD